MAITFDVTVDLPSARELLLGLLHGIKSQLSEKMNFHYSQYLLSVSIGRGWLLKLFAHTADSINTSQQTAIILVELLLFVFDVNNTIRPNTNTLFGLLFGPNRIQMYEQNIWYSRNNK